MLEVVLESVVESLRREEIRGASLCEYKVRLGSGLEETANSAHDGNPAEAVDPIRCVLVRDKIWIDPASGIPRFVPRLSLPTILR